jgi:hypothetical protein
MTGLDVFYAVLEAYVNHDISSELEMGSKTYGLLSHHEKSILQNLITPIRIRNDSYYNRKYTSQMDEHYIFFYEKTAPSQETYHMIQIQEI